MNMQTYLSVSPNGRLCRAQSIVARPASPLGERHTSVVFESVSLSIQRGTKPTIGALKGTFCFA